jgi:WD40 repeat protein
MTDEPQPHAIPPGFTLRHTLRGHTHIVFDLAWSPDGAQLASASWDGTVRMWRVADGALLHTLEHIGVEWVTSVAWSPDGVRLASAAEGWEVVQVWRAADGALLHTLEHIGVEWMTSVAWSPDGAQLAFASDDHTVRVWQAADGALLHTLDGHTSVVYSVAWSPDGARLASASHDGTMRVWQAADGALLHTLEGHSYVVLSVAWSPEGARLASASNDGTMQVWRATDGHLLQTLIDHEEAVLSVRWAADGRLLASKSIDNTVRLWETISWRCIATLPELASNSWPPQLAFHPTRPDVLATLGADEAGKADRVIRLWELDLTLLLGLTRLELDLGADPPPALRAINHAVVHAPDTPLYEVLKPLHPRARAPLALDWLSRPVREFWVSPVTLGSTGVDAIVRTTRGENSS